VTTLAFQRKHAVMQQYYQYFPVDQYGKDVHMLRIVADDLSASARHPLANQADFGYRKISKSS